MGILNQKKKNIMKFSPLPSPSSRPTLCRIDSTSSWAMLSDSPTTASTWPTTRTPDTWTSSPTGPLPSLLPTVTEMEKSATPPSRKALMSPSSPLTTGASWTPRSTLPSALLPDDGAATDEDDLPDRLSDDSRRSRTSTLDDTAHKSFENSHVICQPPLRKPSADHMFSSLLSPTL